ncbi:hypothetical protein F9L06_03770 [Brucella anthropi]|uniref:Mor transcription activator domain-containing protein n=1 Tax=Brucella anthropi TaxID=529 RepID=A0A6I0DZW3_BRUAN|nr:helix-turn-helix domain-containing protein [Brucella anthropi]KAB2803285.1 hypothetical protein F9L06_03770 [Brucella anthropi]
MKTAPAIDALPASLQDVAETLGVSVVLKLIQHFGGIEVRFPKFPADDHPVIKALGKEDGLALCKFLSGGPVYVPHMKSRKSARRDVLALQKSGYNGPAIARQLGISQRHVRRMANRPERVNQFEFLFPVEDEQD